MPDSLEWWASTHSAKAADVEGGGVRCLVQGHLGRGRAARPRLNRQPWGTTVASSSNVLYFNSNDIVGFVGTVSS